jgi:hypothetical protein
MASEENPETTPQPTQAIEPYDVGYGKPPVTTRFQPGQSGNPRGRPRAARNSKTIHNEIMNEKVPVRSAGRQRKVPRREALLLKLVTEALAGSLPAMRLMLDNDSRFNPAAETETGIGHADNEVLKALRRHLESQNVPIEPTDKKETDE